MKVINQTAKSIYNFGDIDTFCADDECINGLPIDEYVEQQTKAAKDRTRKALLRALEALDEE